MVEHHQLGGPDLHRCDPAVAAAPRPRSSSGRASRWPTCSGCRASCAASTGCRPRTPASTRPPTTPTGRCGGPTARRARWRYASTGVDSLEIPDGGSLALTWDGVAGDVTPTTPPGRAAAGRRRRRRPTAAATSAPSAAGGRGGRRACRSGWRRRASACCSRSPPASRPLRRRRTGPSTVSARLPARPAPRGLVAVGPRARRRGVDDDQPAAAAAAGRGGDGGRGGRAAATQPWARSFRLYVGLGVLIVVLRVVFRVRVRRRVRRRARAARPARDPAARLGRRASRCSARSPARPLLAGLYDGLRLATIVICVGAANSLANPKRLLRSVPPALYEIGTALVVAVTVLPQFADSVRRVRAAQALRAGESGRVGAAAPAAGAGARGRPGALPGARRRHGRPRLRAGRRPRARASAAPPARSCSPAWSASASASTPSSTAPRRAGSPLPMLALGGAGRARRAAQRRTPGAALPLPARPVALARAGGGRRRRRGRDAVLVGRDAPADGRVPRRSPWCRR